MLKQTTIFNVSFHLRANFQKSFENSMILPAALSGIFFLINWCLLRVANAAPYRSVSHVNRGWWASLSAHFWTSGIYFCVYYDLVQQQSEPLIEELNMLTTIRTIGRGAESVLGCKPVFLRIIGRGAESAVECKPVFLRVDGCCCVGLRVPTSFCCCDPLQYDQLSSEMRNVRAFFYDVTARILCFCAARQLSTDLESLEISCRQENSR